MRLDSETNIGKSTSEEERIDNKREDERERERERERNMIDILLG